MINSVDEHQTLIGRYIKCDNGVETIDYTSFPGELWAIRYVLTSYFKISRSSPLKNELLSQKMNLKMKRIGCCLELSNSKSSCKVAAPH
jgi:hypothetical protein